MSALTKFPTKARIIMFDKRDNGRWICDGSFAFYCQNPMLTNLELNMTPGIYEKFKGDLILSKDPVPSFERIEERSARCNTEITFTPFSEGLVMVRYNEKFPENIKGDNYVLTYKVGEETRHSYLPDKVYQYLDTFLNSSAWGMYVSDYDATQGLSTIAIVSLDVNADATGIKLKDAAVVALFTSVKPIYDAESLI